ncbi:E3 ubiquitin-protein ligase FANCL [Choanephora cucurbitarum]|uniref:E3 ubiquitin-protein ligase FANCL n=1 Tax=Choanephora cucurbitarum TaxID=101091 RepID=A0A1C7N7K5_9FUNG|nr:E3 ubiquitin-protein ligase FANCL [Choanephora cucurbitarum]
MNYTPFPLILPIQNNLYQGYITIHQIEYQIQIQFKHPRSLKGDQQLYELIQPHLSAVESQLSQATDIHSFLSDLKDLLEANKPTKTIAFNYAYDRYAYIVNELSHIGYDRVHHLSEGMASVTFQTKDNAGRIHLIELALPPKYPLNAARLISCPLPASIDITGRDLHDILIQHEVLVNQHQSLFDCLDDLDKHMRILEPEQPTRADCWRRIALGHHCSLDIELNPDAPVNMKPNKVRFFGNASRVSDLKKKWNNKIWDKQKPIYENLLETFQLVADEQQRSTDYTKTGDIECGICYSYKLNGVETPDIICANAQLA